MEDKTLGSQYEPVSAKRTYSSCNDGSNQDEPQKQPLEVFFKKHVLRNFPELTVKKKILIKIFLQDKIFFTGTFCV